MTTGPSANNTKKKKQDEPDPSVTSSAYARMAGRLALIDAVLGGTEALRTAGEEYLPRHTMETDQSYNSRLASAVLMNFYELTVEGLVGIPFSQGVSFEDDVPEIIKEQAEDIDLRGNHVDVVARRWFKSGLSKGVSWLLVEHPPKKEKADGTPRTLADDRNEGLRPFWVILQPEDVLMVTVERLNGKQYVTHLRFREIVRTRVGFEEIETERIHVREPGRYEVWDKKIERNREVWTKTDEGIITFKNQVPVVPFYAGDPIGVGEIKPPLIDLAYLNVAHWQSYADQQNILSVCRFPMLAASGIESADQVIAVGPNQVLVTESPDAEYYFVEHTGAAVEAGRKQIVDLEEKMSKFGADWLNQRPAYESATGRAIDQQESLSQLQSIIGLFKDAMEMVLSFHAEWLGLKTGGSIIIRSETGPKGYESAELMLLFTLYRAGLINAERMFAELQRRSVIDPDLDPIVETEAGMVALIDRIAKELEPQFFQKAAPGKEQSGAQKRQERRFVGKPAGNDPLKGDR